MRPALRTTIARRRLTIIKVVSQTNANLPLRMRSNSESRLAINIPLAEILILLRARVDNLNIHSLLASFSDVGGDDDELVSMYGVPDAFRWWVFVCWQVEFYGMCWLSY